MSFSNLNKKAPKKAVSQKSQTQLRIPEHIKTKLHFLLHSELSKWRNKSDSYLMFVKEVANYFNINPEKKPDIKF